MCSWTGSGSLISSVILVAVVVGCGGDDGGNAPLPPLVIQRAPTGSGDGQTAAPGEPLASPLRILITRSSEPEAGVDVGWATADGGAVDPATSTTGADGIATATWTLGPAAGAQTATATAADADGSPVTFTATAEVDGPPPLVIQPAPTGSGDGQTAAPGEPLASPLRILITRSSEPEAGVDVGWATADGGAVDPATSTTGADGIATATWTLGPAAGAQTATATAADADGSPVTFTATAEVDEPPPPPADATIQVLGPSGGNRFSPTEVTIQAGQTVRWVWPSGSLDHNVVPDDTQPPSSGGFEDGPNDYSFTFTTAGTYNFYCSNHGGPGGLLMSGRVIVEP